MGNGIVRSAFVPENKQDKIIEELKCRCEEQRYGSMTVEFKIQDGKIMAGEILKQSIKLG